MIKGIKVLVSEKETLDALTSSKKNQDGWVAWKEGIAKEITEDDKFVKVKFRIFSRWFPIAGKNFSVTSLKKE